MSATTATGCNLCGRPIPDAEPHVCISEETARREAFDLAITACHQYANRRGITPVEAALELMQDHPDNLAAYAAVHAYLYSQESKP